MAVSGNLPTSNDKVLYNITVTESNVDTTANTSDITVQVKFWRTNTGYETYGNGTVYATIDGTQYSQAVSSSQKITNSGIVLFNKKFTIAHNADGSKTVNVQAKISISGVLSSVMQGFSVTLTKISVSPTTPKAPTKLTIPDTVSVGDTITLSWSGASGTITGYQMQYAKGYTDNPSNWTDWRKPAVTSGSGSTTDTYSNTAASVNGAGMTVLYRIRAMNGNVASAWCVSNKMTILGAMDVKVGGTWKNGSTWIKVGGTWKRAKCVWIKSGGTWKQSK